MKKVVMGHYDDKVLAIDVGGENDNLVIIDRSNREQLPDDRAKQRNEEVPDKRVEEIGETPAINARTDPDEGLFDNLRRDNNLEIDIHSNSFDPHKTYVLIPEEYLKENRKLKKLTQEQKTYNIFKKLSSPQFSSLSKKPMIEKIEEVGGLSFKKAQEKYGELLNLKKEEDFNTKVRALKLTKDHISEISTKVTDNFEKHSDVAYLTRSSNLLTQIYERCSNNQKKLLCTEIRLRQFEIGSSPITGVGGVSKEKKRLQVEYQNRITQLMTTPSDNVVSTFQDKIPNIDSIMTPEEFARTVLHALNEIIELPSSQEISSTYRPLFKSESSLQDKLNNADEIGEIIFTIVHDLISQLGRMRLRQDFRLIAKNKKPESLKLSQPQTMARDLTLIVWTYLLPEEPKFKRDFVYHVKSSANPYTARKNYVDFATDAVKQIHKLMDMDELETNIVAQPRAKIMGDVKVDYTEEQKEKFKTANVEYSKFKFTEIDEVAILGKVTVAPTVKGILVSEKETALVKTIAELKKQLPNTEFVSISTKGNPSGAVDYFLRLISDEVKSKNVPIFIIMDGDLYGLLPAAKWTYGVVRPTTENSFEMRRRQRKEIPNTYHVAIRPSEHTTVYKDRPKTVVTGAENSWIYKRKDDETINESLRKDIKAVSEQKDYVSLNDLSGNDYAEIASRIKEKINSPA
jgi:hypothetical protein